MSEECLVSVLCTAFNHEQYIRQTLQSFVDQQTDFPFEVLVNDDQSSDGTAEVIREFAEKYPAIIRPFYQEENLFSRGIDIYHTVFYPAARGKYVAMCEGDDYWTDNTKLQRQADFLEAHPEYAACVHNTMMHFCDGSRPDTPHRNPGGDCDVEMDKLIPGLEDAYHYSSLMAKKEIISVRPEFYYVGDSFGFTDYPEALWLRLHGPIHYIDRIMSVYRLNSNAAAWSSGVDGQYDKLVTFLTGKAAMLEAFRSYCPEEYRPLLEEYILRRKFELLYTQGRDREQRKPPYRELLRAMPFRYRLNNFLKSYVPGLQRIYRRTKGYHE